MGTLADILKEVKTIPEDILSSMAVQVKFNFSFVIFYLLFLYYFFFRNKSDS